MSRPPVTFSFEFFPPKTEKAAEQLWSAVPELAKLGPSFMTVTYGAGGSTRDWTMQTAIRMRKETGIPIAVHLTAICTPKADIENIARTLLENDIRHIVALRGDAPKDKPLPDAGDPDYYHYANELVEGLRRIGDFEITVAAYPEKHPEAPDMDTDIQNLKRKCETGADRAVTQFFFDNAYYYRFLEQIQAAGIETPIFPGVLTISNFKNTESFAGKCGSHIPQAVRDRFEAVSEDPEKTLRVGAEFAAEQCLDLIRNGASHIHFYTLNRADLTKHACQVCGLGL